ncbi:MAG: glycosyltransferase family 1 protein, partial [Saprospiraceae bacterium]|nr:glycosyltransferase family 1 protein [Saprospiraceae bacterium]
MIKVAFFAEILIPDFDGASRTMFQLIQRIPTGQFEFLFICGVGPDELYGFECLSLPTVTLPKNTTYKMAVPQLAKRRLKTRLDAFAPDVVHIATPSLLGQYALKYASSHHLPVLSIYHTHFISYIDYYFKSLPFLIPYVTSKVAASQKNFYNRCDLVYVPAEGIMAELKAIGIEDKRMKIWKRGMDTSLFSPQKRNPALMRRLTGNELPTVLFASRLVWEKNLETLIRVYERCRSLQVPCNFVVAGDGVARKACESRMPGAVFLGTVDHETLSELYASADIFLFPSISESYGNVVLEAMASGLPCVLADGGGSRDFVEQGVNGFKCSPNDEVEYVEKIELLLKDKTLL